MKFEHSQREQRPSDPRASYADRGATAGFLAMSYPVASKTNPWAIGTATMVNGGLLAIIILMGLSSSVNRFSAASTPATTRYKDFTLFVPSRAQTGGGGGGGGSNALIDPIVGRLPRFDMHPLTPPQVPLLENPKLAVNPAIAIPPDAKLPDNPLLPNIGVHDSPNVDLASGGPGSGGIGSGHNGGVGPGDGIGYGPGSERGVGGSVYRPGVGGVTNPIPIVTPEAEFSDEARRNKYQGICMISIIVDARGYPQDPRILRALGMGLDEKAIEAVQRYRFKPALKDGKPVASIITVAVNFRLY
jgi:TonB family protein